MRERHCTLDLHDMLGRDTKQRIGDLQADIVAAEERLRELIDGGLDAIETQR